MIKQQQGQTCSHIDLSKTQNVLGDFDALKQTLALPGGNPTCWTKAVRQFPVKELQVCP